jgi:hypothetical protein
MKTLKGSILGAFALLVLGAPLVMRAGDLHVRILKVDPNPVSMNVGLDVILRIDNVSAAVMHAEVHANSDFPEKADLDVPAKGSVTVTIPARYGTVGPRRLSVNVGTLVEAWVLVRQGAVFKRELRSQFIVSDTATAAIDVRGPLPSPPPVSDVSPDEPEGKNNSATASGVVQQLAGREGALYAVSKTAGVWQSTAGGRWQQLLASPTRAISIAIDPGDERHIVVGEREDETIDPLLGRSALWQSTSSGQWWELLHDPATQNIRQSIPSVVFSPLTRTLIFATHKGVGRWPIPQKPNTEASLVYPRTAAGDITAVAAGDVRLWARTVSEIMYSDDDGLTWTREALPVMVAPSGTPAFAPEYDSAVNGNGNDRATLAGFDDRAFLIFHKPDSVKAPDWSGSPLLVFTPNDPSPARRWIAQWTHDNDGRGLGGRRFVKAYHLFHCPGLDERIGQRLQLFYGSGQGLQQAISLQADGHVEFSDPPVLTYRPLEKVDTRSQSDLHADLWDVHIGTDYCPSVHPTVWLAADGGVYEGSGGGGSLSSLGWRTRSRGLHLHNAHDLRIVHASSSWPTLLAYPTTDNGAWFRDRNGEWSSQPFMGDASAAASDTVSPVAAVWRQPWGNHKPMGVLSGFGTSFLGSDGSATKKFELNRDTTFDGPTAVLAVIPLPSETVNSDRTLDIAMLTRVPLTDSDGNVVTGEDAIGKKWPTPATPRTVVVRNPRFTVHPNASADKFEDWGLISDAVPSGAQQLWTSGGLVHTRYYVLGDQTSGSPSGLSVLQLGSWTPLGGNLQFLAKLSIDDQGPVFPNPYVPNLVIGTYAQPTGAQMIGISRDGGRSFCDSPALTALLTDSGNLALSSMAVSQHFSEVGGTFHGAPGRLTPTSVEFDPADPYRVFIASMEARIVTASLRPRPADIVSGNKCPAPIWHDISPAFRAPRPYISAIRYDAGTLFVSTQGRGILAITSLDHAREAAWFVPNNTFSPSQSLASVRGGSGGPISYGYVTAMLVPLSNCASATAVTESHRTDDNGEYFMATSVPACEYRVDLEFRSDGTHEAAKIRFRSTAP